MRTAVVDGDVLTDC